MTPTGTAFTIPAVGELMAPVGNWPALPAIGAAARRPPAHIPLESTHLREGFVIRREEPKVGRNDPCPCGSGRKHKNCCGK